MSTLVVGKDAPYENTLVYLDEALISVTDCNLSMHQAQEIQIRLNEISMRMRSRIAPVRLEDRE